MSALMTAVVKRRGRPRLVMLSRACATQCSSMDASPQALHEFKLALVTCFVLTLKNSLRLIGNGLTGSTPSSAERSTTVTPKLSLVELAPIWLETASPANSGILRRSSWGNKWYDRQAQRIPTLCLRLLRCAVYTLSAAEGVAGDYQSLVTCNEKKRPNGLALVAS